MSFNIEKTVDLSEFGWADCYIKLKSVPYSELKDLINKGKRSEEDAFGFIKSKFVSGKAYDDDKKENVDIVADDLEKLPTEIVMHCIDVLLGNKKDPNSLGR